MMRMRRWALEAEIARSAGRAAPRPLRVDLPSLVDLPPRELTRITSDAALRVGDY
jgi:hypothetical protein